MYRGGFLEHPPAERAPCISTAMSCTLCPPGRTQRGPRQTCWRTWLLPSTPCRVCVRSEFSSSVGVRQITFAWRLPFHTCCHRREVPTSRLSMTDGGEAILFFIFVCILLSRCSTLSAVRCASWPRMASAPNSPDRELQGQAPLRSQRRNACHPFYHQSTISSSHHATNVQQLH